MELKLITYSFNASNIELLIVPYGIETTEALNRIGISI